MYRPHYTQEKNKKDICELADKYPFVTLITATTEGQAAVTHLPVVCEFKNEEIVAVRGHIAKANPHYQALISHKKVKVIFHGPHLYVSPLWYKSGPDVPTWNYAVIHVDGNLELEPGFEKICNNLIELSRKFESSGEWKFFLPEDLKSPQQLESHISAFVIRPEKITAKFKLNQNRPLEDQVGVIEALQKSSDVFASEVSKLMKKNLER